MLYMFRFFELIIKSVRILPFSWGCLQSLGAGLTTIHDRENAETFTCGECNYSTLHKTNLKRHRTTVHDRENAKSFPCGECNYSTLHKTLL